MGTEFCLGNEAPRSGSINSRGACHLSGMAHPPSQSTMMGSLSVPTLREHILAQETIFVFTRHGMHGNNRRNNEEEKEQKVFGPKYL